MLIYLYITAFLSSFFVLSGTIHHVAKKRRLGENYYLISLLISIIFIVFIVLQMSDSAGDATVYAGHFYSIGNQSFTSAVYHGENETGFVIITWLISQFTSNYNVYRLIFFAIQIIVFSIAIKRISPTLGYAILTSYLWYIFFLGYSLAAMRQGIAMSIYIYTLSLFYIPISHRRHSTIKYSVLCLTMLLIHRSSILMLPLVFFLYLKYNFNINNKNLLYIATIVMASILLIVIYFRGPINNYFQQEYFIKSDQYASEVWKERYGNKGTRFDFIAFNTMPLLFSLYIILKKQIRLTPLHYSFFYAYLVFLPFSSMSHSDRFAAYTFIQIPLFLFYHFTYLKPKFTFTALLSLLTIIIGLFVYWPVYFKIQGL